MASHQQINNQRMPLSQFHKSSINQHFWAIIHCSVSNVTFLHFKSEEGANILVARTQIALVVLFELLQLPIKLSLYFLLLLFSKNESSAKKKAFWAEKEKLKADFKVGALSPNLQRSPFTLHVLHIVTSAKATCKHIQVSKQSDLSNIYRETAHLVPEKQTLNLW